MAVYMLSYGCARSGVVLVPTVGFIAFYGHTCEVWLLSFHALKPRIAKS